MAAIRLPTWKWIAGGVVVLIVAAGGYINSGSFGRRGGNDRVVLQVIDGDTLDVNGHPVDLPGIDAPELGQKCLDGSRTYTCGLTAAFELSKLLALEDVKCVRGGGKEGVYDCATPDAPLGLLLVEDGLAVARSGTAEQVAEKKAREVPLGIWRGAFVDPKDWRAGKRLPEERDGEPCPVLGVDMNNERVYVVPTDSAYDKWKDRDDMIRERFCSDEEARASGRTHLALR